MGGEVAGAAVAVPAFEGAEGCGCGGGGLRVDCAVADHLGEAGEAGYAVGADTVAVGFGDEAGGESGAWFGEAEVEEGFLDGGGEVGDGDAEHVGIRAYGGVGE